jgi:hypothetical protein
MTRMMRRTIAAFVALATLCATCGPAFAYCGPWPRLIRAEYGTSRLVVVAKLEAKHAAKIERDVDSTIYTLSVTEMLRGYPVTTIKVREDNDSGSATFDWRIGESYLLFLHPVKNGMWRLDGCGNSGRLRDSTAAMKIVRSMQNDDGGWIEGFISQMTDDARSLVPLAGVRVKIHGDEKDYEAVTDAKGIYRVHVAMGMYSVTSADVPGLEFLPPDTVASIYQSGDRIRIDAGRAAQLNFTATPKK